ncbi:MAG: diaminopimelate epimerase [Candidatus Sedimenticola endophacoides]|uniref:Diaminopimelate epimerase n=1 Tax=Candidatus Sedimenticola endophacoides TaxID=2548426 RepID=A0A6N4E3A2_9GAMM|nr:MAG: diaminopimelate epimerase [Candidatus Sedimenticola endophacoides]OQX34148.1 MAG: diaminopimelate epimerase [Candidatus Sedimenticola endophacoides]OQX42163.1 MAG: diaminopimelate epimerase [Candidatus Sedimenticola endophacoides]OQX44296.1 MAG: diaminopimelate epimerase [Candidatus Sedimenticola endophacoides]PUE00759.1 MAG: diaminopimelate epimerase [Candidatus Sedimenticola endophacoides]
MLLNFTKMHGLGNDFVVIDATARPLALSPEQCRRLADRRVGIGCDQILLVEAPRDPATDFYYRIINADGSEVEQCGNGARCFARFVRDKGLSAKERIDVGTRAGNIRLFLQADGQVRVNMGDPVLEPERIPFRADARAACYRIEAAGESLEIGAVSMGNPHAVLRVADVERADVARLGPLLESHPHFPRRVNVGFMQIGSRDHIRLRVYERGAGETLACGTGACAAVVSGQIQGLLDERVRVSLPGGDLVIEWAGEGHPVWMSGPAETVFEGRITL